MLPLGKLIFFIISMIFLVCSLIVNIFIMINKDEKDNSESKLLRIINVAWFVGNILTIIYVLNTY